MSDTELEEVQIEDDAEDDRHKPDDVMGVSSEAQTSNGN